jgi:hypothetical protein
MPLINNSILTMFLVLNHVGNRILRYFGVIREIRKITITKILLKTYQVASLQTANLTQRLKAANLTNYYNLIVR